MAPNITAAAAVLPGAIVPAAAAVATAPDEPDRHAVLSGHVRANPSESAPSSGGRHFSPVIHNVTEIDPGPIVQRIYTLSLIFDRPAHRIIRPTRRLAI